MAQRKMRSEKVLGFLKPYPVEHMTTEATTNKVPIYRGLTKNSRDIHITHHSENRSIARARIKIESISSRAQAESFRLNGLPDSYIPPLDITDLWRRSDAGPS